MSRAFVKEDGEAPPPLPLERPVGSAPNCVTPRGASLIDREIDRLEEALSSDPEDEAAIRRDLRYWTTRRASAQLVELDPAPAAVGFGTRVVIRRGRQESEVEIVGEDEADPAAGLLAWTSPLAVALDGAEPGEIVELAAGGRTVPIEILAVSAGRSD